MTSERTTSSDTPTNPRLERREILCADVDRWSADRRIWQSDSDADTSAQIALCAALRRAVATSLTDKQREVIEAYFFEGLSQGDIARRLGVTQQVVQKRIYGASRDGRLVGGAIPRLRAALSPLCLQAERKDARRPR